MDFGITKSGYKPILYALTYTKSPYLSGHIELFNNTTLSSYYKSVNTNIYDVNFKAYVLYETVS